MVSEDILRIVLADDHAHIRAQVREALEAGRCAVVGEGASADEAVGLAIEHKPDAVLLDVHMPGGGIQAAQRIVRQLPDTRVVMLTQSDADDDLFDSLRAGACGYLMKGSDPASLEGTLRGVLSGEAAMSPQLVMRVLDEFRAPAKRRFSRKSAAARRLSPREWEVMDLLRQGLTTDEAAKRLFMSPTTVRVHVSAVLRKLSVQDREAAFRLLSD